MNTYKEYVIKLIKDSSLTFKDTKSKVLDNKDIEIHCLLHGKYHTTNDEVTKGLVIEYRVLL